MSNFICYKCNSEMEEKKTQIKAGWGEYKLTIDGIKGYVCKNCGETIYAPEEAKMIQELGRGFADNGDTNKPELLNVSETADLLRVSNQTIYNMLKDGRLKAYKCGREWRFNRKDILSLIDNTSFEIAARNNNKSISDNDKKVISEELDKM